MIYYFSGTGNSLYVARHLADALGDRLCPMTFASPSDDEVIGLVFPVYGWGIPNVVEAFVRSYKASLLGQSSVRSGVTGEDSARQSRERLDGSRYLYAVMTCGDDMGYTDKVLEKALGRKLDAAFSVLMPDVYVCLPGFDVDSREECREKFHKEEEAIKDIVRNVTERNRVRHLVRGGFPWAKTYILRPLFNRFLLTDKYFHVDVSKCVACGRCQKMCPVGNILLVDDVPQWQSHCAGCLACYHACPHHAINFGRMTQKKGQYNLLRMKNEE